MLNRTLFWTTYNASTGPSTSQLVSLTSLCGYWKLDEANKTVWADDAYSTRDGSQGGGVSCGSTGKIGSSYNFRSGPTNTCVMLPADASSQMGTSDFTMTAWVYPSYLPAATWKGIIGADNTNGWCFGCYGPSLQGAKNGVAGTAASGLTLSINQWSFVACVFDSTATTNNLTFYHNASTATQSFDYNFDSAYSNYIGVIEGPNNNKFDGNIDEVGVWKRKLTSGEISALYNNGNGLAYPFTA